MMAFLIKKAYGHIYDLIFVFANTGREKKETLVFLDKVDKHFNLGVVWVEAVVHHGRRKACTHKVVTFETACRNGDVFEEVIKKYGIPNSGFKHCTRELKRNPIKSYAKSLGWSSYRIAIGYRADEPKRVNWEKAKKEKQWYLLAELGIKKPDVALFWSQQPFDLGLKDYEGNCKLCHKKARRKLLTQIVESPEDTVWVKDMEVKYEQVKPGKKKKNKTPVRFFREGDTIDDLIEESRLPFNRAIDQSNITVGARELSEFNVEMDYEEECAESCEPF